MVGVAGFEPATPSSRTRCATRLRYTPKPAEPSYNVAMLGQQGRSPAPARAPPTSLPALRGAYIGSLAGPAQPGFSRWGVAKW
jgi:hypothetical protein